MNQRPHKHRPSATRRLGVGTLLLSLLATTVGCDTLFQRSGDATPTSAHPGADLNRDGADAGSEDGRREVAAYVNFTDVLESSDEQGWHTIFETTLAAYQEDPSRERRLRLALVLSLADRKSKDSRVSRNLLSDAHNLLRDSVQDPDPIPPLVRKFAQLELAEVETRLALHEELQSLRSQLAKAHQESQSAHRVRYETEARMRRIDAALSEANAKLEAVMNIEHKIGATGKETFP